MRFTQGCGGVAHRAQDEREDHSVERGVGEGKRFGLGNHETSVGRSPARESNGRRIGVDRGDARVCRVVGELASSTYAHLENVALETVRKPASQPRKADVIEGRREAVVEPGRRRPPWLQGDAMGSVVHEAERGTLKTQLQL